MLVTVPSWDNPIFQEFRKWHKKCEVGPYDEKNYEAKKSIEAIAEHIYGRDTGSIVGWMIMQIDLHEMEKENQ